MGFQHTNSKIDFATDPEQHSKQATAGKRTGDKKGRGGERAHGKGESRVMMMRMVRKERQKRVSLLFRE